MQTKLTLRMDETLIERAKSYAAKRGRSLSSLVADYLAALDALERPTKECKSYPPLTASLFGVLKETGVDEEDYYKHLEEKNL